jgi:hypothetical protein
MTLFDASLIVVRIALRERSPRPTPSAMPATIERTSVTLSARLGNTRRTFDDLVTSRVTFKLPGELRTKPPDTVPARTGKVSRPQQMYLATRSRT